jgi:Homeodomain
MQLPHHACPWPESQVTLFEILRAKDKAILEESYNSNPKPDKAARLKIVQRVSLNEKEVQVCCPSQRRLTRPNLLALRACQCPS